MNGGAGATIGRGRRPGHRAAAAGAWPPSRRLTRRCSSCGPASSRSFAATVGSRAAPVGERRNNRSQRQLESARAVGRREPLRNTADRAHAPQENQAQRESREILNRLQRPGPPAGRPQRAAPRAAIGTAAGRNAAAARGARARAQAAARPAAGNPPRHRRAHEPDGSCRESARRRRSREQMEEGRSHVAAGVRSARGGPSFAGADRRHRAGRQLSDVRDQFRQQSANRFSEEMTEMRREARDLDERQQQLSQQLSGAAERRGRPLAPRHGRPSRSAGRARGAAARAGRAARADAQTIEEAEEPEPLLAGSFTTRSRSPSAASGDALDVTQRLLGRGIEREAGEAMRAADQGIRNLRQGVERAAESVLGDETEALRRAQQRGRISWPNELNREIEQARGGDAAGEERNQRASTRAGRREQRSARQRSARRTRRESTGPTGKRR